MDGWPEIVAEAESWKGTPHRHQASIKGLGCDCKGLIVGVARHTGRQEAQSDFAMMCDYGDPDPLILKSGLAALFDRLAGPIPGAVLLLKWWGARQPACHLAIMGYGEIIHSYGRRPSMVVGTNASEAFRCWPLHSAWGWRGA